ncbi:transmembrane sensor [Pedobacter sp. CG_S7]|uniref:FecR family protein n=1 Tax=Pedobacter sp. CG_S7 TaxID=3143930 RepID=UPI00339A5248
MNEEKIKELLNRYQSGQCTEVEKAWVESWYNNLLKDSKTVLAEDIIKKDLKSVYKKLPNPYKVKFVEYLPRIAASILFVMSLSVGFYLFQKRNSNSVTQISLQIKENDEAISLNKTFLTLTNGVKIALDSAPIGEIAEQGGIKITKVKEGLIAYTKISNKINDIKTAELNIVTTTKGGQYQIILSDGTNIWLNTASSLKFPTSFSQGKRNVELIGEGYFEVAKNKAMPFKVLTEHQEVKVLGTHFNINSYNDEPTTKTTLLEGSVKILELNSQRTKLLEPGEQSSVKVNGNIKIARVNTENAIAWKSGVFQFQNSDIESVMRQLSRWYDVDVEFEGELPAIKLWGEVHRNASIIKALEFLSYFDLKYKIVNKGETKKIIITTYN